MAGSSKIPGDKILVLDTANDDVPPTEEQVREYAEYLGLDFEKESHLMWIARDGVSAPVPTPWKACTENGEDIFYFNFETGESLWDHPSDEEFRKLLAQYRLEGGRSTRRSIAEDRISVLPPIEEISNSSVDSPIEQSRVKLGRLSCATSEGGSLESSFEDRSSDAMLMQIPEDGKGAAIRGRSLLAEEIPKLTTSGKHEQTNDIQSAHDALKTILETFGKLREARARRFENLNVLKAALG